MCGCRPLQSHSIRGPEWPLQAGGHLEKLHLRILRGHHQGGPHPHVLLRAGLRGAAGPQAARNPRETPPVRVDARVKGQG